MAKFVSHKNEVLEAKDLALERALETIGLRMERYAKQEINNKDAIDTGRLINSVTHATEAYQGQGSYSDNKGNVYGDATAKEPPAKNTVYLGTNVEYAPYIELGTSRSAPRSYLAPAVQNHVSEYKQIAKNELQG